MTNGIINEVSPPDDLLIDNIFTDNHLSSSIFAKEDLYEMIRTQVIELRASTPQGIYYSLLRIGKVPQDNTLADEFKKVTSIKMRYLQYKMI